MTAASSLHPRRLLSWLSGKQCGMSGVHLAFPECGQNTQGIALGEIFQSREEQSPRQ